MKLAEFIVDDGQLGTIHFVTSKRAKRLNIRIDPNGQVRVAVPPNGSIAAAKAFLEIHRNWILKHQKHVKLREINHERILIGVPNDEANAREALTNRISNLAAQFQFKINRVSFRRQRTRWGSCSRQNNVSLNLKIAGLPQHLQDYILLHELVHSKVKNHGPRFWLMLETVTDGKARVLAKEIRKYRLV